MKGNGNMKKEIGQKKNSPSLSRFSFSLYKELRNLIIPKLPQVGKIFDNGFFRFDKEKLVSIYVQCLYKDLHVGFIKVDCGKKLKINSMYYAINNSVEVRYNIKGEYLCEYHSRNEGEDLIINRIKYGEKVSEYVINRRSIDNFPNLLKILQDKNMIELSGTKFKFFTKENRSVIYLMVQ